MKLKNIGTILGAGLIGVATVSSAAEEAQNPVEMKYDRNTREVSAQPQTGVCPVRVVSVVDDRQNKETIGRSMKGALISGDMSKWVTEGLADLNNFGFKVDVTEDASPPQDGSVLIKAHLTRAYTWQVGLKIFSMVALKAQFINKNGVLQEKYYRAHGDKTNMWGAESEYVTTLNYGINNLLPVMAKDLVGLCKGTKVEQYSYAGPESTQSN